MPTLEDEIEMQRQKKVAELKKAGKGTPVTPESFAVWQERKRQKRAAEARKMVEAEMKKKKGGKGLSVLSGRALYEYKKELFDDRDDDANDSGDDESPPQENNGTHNNDKAVVTKDDKETAQVEQVAAQVQSELFLEGDDEDLDDLEDD